jgi:subtilase family serine protease
MLLTRVRSIPTPDNLRSNGFGAGCRNFSGQRLILALLTATLAFGTAGAQAVQRSGDGSEFRAIPNHVPSWAKADNFAAAMPDEQKLPAMTLVLARHPDREQAFDALLAAQQDPASPEYHHWLTPAEIGERFGLSTEELDTLKDWLESEGLHVDWVAPGRNFIGFSGNAGDVSRAFQTELNYYDVNTTRKFSVATPPMVPTALAPLVKAIRGLHTIDERSLHRERIERHSSPDITAGPSTYFVVPADFATIYDVPSTYTGKGVTVGIVGGSRVATADLTNFEKLTVTSFANPTVIVPTAFGATDPGPAATSAPAPDAQVEATLDVFRVSSVAHSAKVLLVVNAPDLQGGVDIFPDAQYLVQTTPVPAQIMNISFGSCESEDLAGVSSWDVLFKQAAGEGVSVFVSSGDSGASGCDAHSQAPPADPAPNSPNSICSSSYATCVGGTEFNDASDYSKYWSSTNSPDFESALSYIPEGAWNEPENSNDETQVAASGGGVSKVIPTPSWQTGKGVPSARTGRYTPDIAFLASEHDGYFGCMLAAEANSCEVIDGSFEFLVFSGTSAAAPDMAGITALLDQKLGGKGQGNLNPALYSLAATSPSVFHDVTVATSGVSPCTVTKPSMCNNSIPGVNGLTGGQAGYEVGVGYDEVTGLGSLDVGKFLAAFAPAKLPIAVTGKSSAVTTTGATLAGTVNANGQATKYWFAYGISSTLSGAAKTALESASGSSTVAVTAKVTKLIPGTKYYFQLQASDSGGTATGAVASFTTAKASQTITFKQPASPVKYGVAPIKLTAESTSGLVVAFKVLSGPAKVSGSTLTITGAGTVVVAANQAGNKSYLPAVQVTRSITVTKAQLTVTAENLSMTQGSAVPALQRAFTGWVNGDTRSTASKGVPALSTTATKSSVPGSYPIKITVGTLSAPNYTFKFVNGIMTVKP